MSRLRRLAAGSAVALGGVVAYDVTQRHHAILRNFPVVGHLRYILETFGPELRQYIVTSNNEERPFSRDQRTWVYQSSKLKPNTVGFGSDNEMENGLGYLIIKPDARPYPAPPEGGPGSGPEHLIPAAKILGAAHGRRHAFRPRSVVNISGMSFGALSAPAVEALNRGAALAPCLQNTGEGGLSEHHCHGGELIFQIGTGYFGCRDADGHFDLDALLETIARGPVRALEVKLSQGAKPGVGGMVPAAKMTPEIAAIRGVEAGKDCHSPPCHSAFTTVDELIEFCERIGAATGLPIGIKSAVGEQPFWEELAARMETTGGGPDFITVDGGEGGTGAAPLSFADHVALPFKMAFSRVYAPFAHNGLNERIAFIGSAKLGMPHTALFAFSLGADMVNVGREAMMAIGCIQAQRCHTGRCPTGVATQNPWLVRGLDPDIKAARAANYVRTLRRELGALTRTCGEAHPSLITPDQLELMEEGYRSRTAEDALGYLPAWRRTTPERRAEIERLVAGDPHAAPA